MATRSTLLRRPTAAGTDRRFGVGLSGRAGGTPPPPPPTGRAGPLLPDRTVLLGPPASSLRSEAAPSSGRLRAVVRLWGRQARPEQRPTRRSHPCRSCPRGRRAA